MTNHTVLNPLLNQEQIIHGVDRHNVNTIEMEL